MIKTLTDINTETPEGKLLMAALAMISAKYQLNADEVIKECNELVEEAPEGVS